MEKNMVRPARMNFENGAECVLARKRERTDAKYMVVMSQDDSCWELMLDKSAIISIGMEIEPMPCILTQFCEEGYEVTEFKLSSYLPGVVLMYIVTEPKGSRE